MIPGRCRTGGPHHPGGTRHAARGTRPRARLPRRRCRPIVGAGAGRLRLMPWTPAYRLDTTVGTGLSCVHRRRSTDPMTSTAPRPPSSAVEGPGVRPLLDGQRTTGEQLLVKVFVVLPLLALLAAVPLAWGWGLSWTDIGLATFFYFLSGLGITVGFHRHFTHRAFKATRALRIGLASPGAWPSKGRSSAGWPTTAATTRSPTGRATRTRPGCTARVLARWPRGSCTPTSAGCSCETSERRALRPGPPGGPRSAARAPALPRLVAGQPGRPALLGGLITWSWWGAR